MMTWPEIYAEVKTWQQGIAALIGFFGLAGAALLNFYLNRRRDSTLRKKEACSVAAALYGEIVLLRERAAQVARAVANVHEAHGTQKNPSVKFDKHFIEANRLPEPSIYRALTPKLGLLPGSLIVPITSFYENIYMVGLWLPQMAPQSDRPYSYAVSSILNPAVNAVEDIVPALKEIERMVGISPVRSEAKLDLGKAVMAIEMDKLNFEGE